MRKTTRQIASVMLAAAMACSLLSGCGGGADNKTAESTESTGKTTEESSAKAEDAKADAQENTDYSDDVIVYGMTQAWDTINPYGSSTGSIYQNLVCDKLYDRLAFIEEAGTGVSPRGAKSWEMADEGKAVIFHLDENAKWHDGEPVTAND